MIKKNLRNLGVTLLTGSLILMNSTNLFAYHSQNSAPMYDGVLIVAVDVDPGDWGARTEYTGYNPLGLPDLLLQSNIQGRDGIIRLFDDWAINSANGNKYIVRTGGSNALGNTGNNYARAIGWYWGGGDRRVATSYQ